MKTAFISDIHGNYEALRAVLSAIDSLDVSAIYCSGDIVGYYPQINECCEELKSRGILSTMGNHDWYLASGGFCPRSRSVNECLTYQRGLINSENLEWLKCLPVQIQIDNIHIVHGGWTNPVDEYLDPSEDYFQRISGDIFISGHTHVQLLRSYPGKQYCNPGSVGQPRDGDPRAAFAVLDGKEFQLYRVDYDMEKVFDLMKAAGFSDYFYGGLKTGSRTLRKLDD